MAAKRKPDDIQVLCNVGSFDQYESIELTHDLNEVASCTMTFGDDSTWNAVQDVIAPGEPISVVCNGVMLFAGRFEANSAPQNARESTKVKITARTRLSDARIASAQVGLSFKNTSIKAFILKLFAPLGYTESDFAFDAAAARDVVTGKKSGAKDLVDLDKPKADQLKVQPPETVWETALRVLKWQHLMIWDNADGRIVVGKPDDTQSPIYTFVSLVGSGSDANNVIDIVPSVDWSEQPGEVWVFGATHKQDIRKAKNKGVAVDQDVVSTAARTGQFNRIVTIPSDGSKHGQDAQAQAQREMASRSKRKQAWEVTYDGWTFFDGSARSTNFWINTVAAVISDAHRNMNGPYLVSKTSRSFNCEGHASARMNLIAKGLYDV